jgi:catechol 2,3-dioxygenase-like lactoylglutathione lyase family enzyme
MEQMIDGLLKDFETGKIGRRQLIKSLALAACAAPAAGAQEAPAAAAPWKTTALDHISYAVADYKKSAAFYSGLMGWEIRSDNGKNQCTLGIGNIGEIIIRNRREPAAIGVINHISWGVQPWDTEKVKAELERRGLKPRPDMQGDDFKSFHVLDPDGWDLQISNQNGTQRK